MRLSKLSASLLVALVATTLAPAALAQSGRRLPQKAEKPQDEVIRLRADEVLLNITVFDSFGRQVTNLGKDEFIIAENGERQEIASFATAEVPVNVVLLLDASGSVVGQIDSLRQAATSFVNELGPEDTVSVIQFHSTVELIQDWTSSRDEISHAISWRFRPGMVRTSEGRSSYGMTALYDAIYLCAEEQLEKVEGRKAVIILTDGIDTISKVAYDHAVTSLIRAGAVVYVVSKARALLALAPRAYHAQIENAERLMTNMADRTGGRIFSPLKDDDLKENYEKVARELKSQYILTYVPKNDARDGKLRRVSVYLTRPGYSVRTRDSYYAPKG